MAEGQQTGQQRNAGDPERERVQRRGDRESAVEDFCRFGLQRRLIDQIAHLTSVAIERERAAEALRASVKLARGQAEALTQAVDALATETNPDKIVEHVLQTVIAQLNAHSCSVWLKDADTGLMVFEFGVDGRFKTKFESAVAAITPSSPIQTLAAWQEVFRTGKPSLMDVRESVEFPWRATLLERGMNACLWIPMLIDGKVEGVVGVRLTQMRTFRPEEMDLARSLANRQCLESNWHASLHKVVRLPLSKSAIVWLVTFTTR